MDEPGGGWVVVNYTGDTLTDSASGAIGTWVLGLVRAAQRAGTTVPVITKAHSGLPSSWPYAVEIPYPWRSFKGNGRVDALLRRRTHYVHPWQPRWNKLVTGALLAAAPEPSDLLFHNDPELAVHVADALPQHRVWHLVHGTHRMQEVWKGRFLKSARALAVSDFIARWLENELGAPTGAVDTLYPGVDSDLFTPSTKSAPPLISYVGLLNERKAPDLLLAACEHLASQANPPRFAVTVVGATNYYAGSESDPYVDRLHQAAHRLADSGVEVHLTGFLRRSAVAEALGRASIHVVPSRVDEGFSLSALEGMAAGAATVVSRCGGLPEAVGDAAVVVPADDVEALARALETLLRDPGERCGLARRGRDRAMAMSWDRTWRELVRRGNRSSVR